MSEQHSGQGGAPGTGDSQRASSPRQSAVGAQQKEPAAAWGTARMLALGTTPIV